MKTQSQISTKARSNNGRNQSINRRSVSKIPRNYGDAAERKLREALESGIALDMPGIMAGRTVDLIGILWFLAGVLFNCENTIVAALNGKQINGRPRFRSPSFKSHDQAVRLRSRLEWRQASLLARAIHLNDPEVCTGSEQDFNSPFAGLASTLSLSAIDIVEFFAGFLHRHSDAIARAIKDSRRETDADLADALMIAEVVLYHCGLETELDVRAGGFLQPTTLQLQAWEIHAAALEQRLAA